MAYYIAKEAGLYILFTGNYRRMDPAKLFSKEYNYRAEVDGDYWYGPFGAQELKTKVQYFKEAPVRVTKTEWMALYDGIVKMGKLRDIYLTTAKALYSNHKKKGNKNGK